MTVLTSAQSVPSALPLRVHPAWLADIPREAWDRLADANPAATPFARWTFHRAWWDAYGSQARQHYLVVTHQTAGDEIVAIVPLMTRTEPALAPDDLPAEGPMSVTRLLLAASYHADYATVLARPADMPDVVAALLQHIERIDEGDRPWDVVDLRRLRTVDPFRVALARAVATWQAPTGWSVQEEVEDVCPVVTLPADWDAYLAGLSKKARHEIRRKLRRAERHGPLSLEYLPLARASVDRFIDLHQARWGESGLFTANARGDRARLFLHRLVELEGAEGEATRLHIGVVRVADRPLFMLVGFGADGTCYFYNAGIDPTALELSPGVVGTALYLRDRIGKGDLRFDFLRGNEEYKYQWGAVDEAVHRILIEREPTDRRR